MIDLLLIFPPQWSPFQPALSLPSLAAWLKRAGFCVRCLDFNVAFYHWLLSDECAQLLLQQIEQKAWSEPIKGLTQNNVSNFASLTALYTLGSIV
jgi:hypothetical protein